MTLNATADTGEVVKRYPVYTITTSQAGPGVDLTLLRDGTDPITLGYFNGVGVLCLMNFHPSDSDIAHLDAAGIETVLDEDGLITARVCSSSYYHHSYAAEEPSVLPDKPSTGVCLGHEFKVQAAEDKEAIRKAADAIIESFGWSDSPEGCEFWGDVFDRLREMSS